MPAPDAPNPYLTGSFAPVDREIVAHDLQVIGRVPDDLSGMFVRNGSNPRFAPIGRYHWFDGDGMLHGVRFENGKASYRNRWVLTQGLRDELEAGRALSTGIMEPPDFRRRGGPFKDTANTDLVFHDGRLLALWWLGGKCYEISLPALDTVGVRDFSGPAGALGKGLSAHPKVCPATGEMMYFDHQLTPPYLTYGVIASDGKLTHKFAIDLPGARLQHDMAITRNHSILFDLPLLWDAELLARGKTRVRFDRSLPSRFGILPRHGKNSGVSDGNSDAKSNHSGIRWFEASACYMYHSINAWEDGECIVMVGCRIENPLPDKGESKPGIPRLDILELEPRLHEWRFNLRTGAVAERMLDDELTEFPRMNNAHLGSPSRYSYNPRIAPSETLLYDGVIKYDTASGAKETHAYGPGRFGGETTFAPRRSNGSRLADPTPAPTNEDDGYVLTFVHDERENRSELLVLDARNFKSGPVARVLIPQRVPIGYHSWWISESDFSSRKS